MLARSQLQAWFIDALLAISISTSLVSGFRLNLCIPSILSTRWRFFVTQKTLGILTHATTVGVKGGGGCTAAHIVASIYTLIVQGFSTRSREVQTCRPCDVSVWRCPVQIYRVCGLSLTKYHMLNMNNLCSRLLLLSLVGLIRRIPHFHLHPHSSQVLLIDLTPPACSPSRLILTLPYRIRHRLTDPATIGAGAAPRISTERRRICRIYRRTGMRSRKEITGRIETMCLLTRSCKLWGG